jgi:DNA anti-recombination protein RmuC
VDLISTLIGIVVGALFMGVLLGRLLGERQPATDLQKTTLEERVRHLDRDLQDHATQLAEARAREQSLEEELQRAAEQRAAALEAASRVSGLEEQLAQRDAELTRLRVDLTARDVELAQERTSVQQKLALLNDAHASLQDAFKALCADALRDNNQAFLQLAQQSLKRFQQGAQADLDARRTAVEEPVRCCESAWMTSRASCTTSNGSGWRPTRRSTNS